MNAARRIAVVGSWLSVEGGGAAHSSRLQAEIYARLGFAPTLFGLSSAHQPDDNREGYGSQIVRASPADADAGHALVDLVARDIRTFHYVHLQGPDVLLMAQCAAICRSAEVPYLYSPRGSQAIIRREVTARGATLARDADEKLVRAASAICVTSDIERRNAGSVLQGARLVQISNPVDLAPFAPAGGAERARIRAALGIGEEERALIHFGRIAPEKNLSFLIDLLAEARRDADRLFLVGPETPGYAAELRARARACGLLEQVVLFGPVEREERRHWLAAADLVLIPSFSENFCLSLVEAASVGTPLLVSPAIGALEYVNGGNIRVRPLIPAAWIAALAERRSPRPADHHPFHAKLVERFSIQTIAREWRRALETLGWLPVTGRAS